MERNNGNIGNSQELDIETLMAQLEAERAKNALLVQEKQEWQEQENLRREEESLQEWASKEKRFLSTRNTLVLRRTENHEQIAPARDVRDYLELWDLKDPHTKSGKKTRVNEKELKLYQKMKAEGCPSTFEVFSNRWENLQDKNKMSSGEVDEEEFDSECDQIEEVEPSAA